MAALASTPWPSEPAIGTLGGYGQDAPTRSRAGGATSAGTFVSEGSPWVRVRPGADAVCGAGRGGRRRGHLPSADRLRPASAAALAGGCRPSSRLRARPRGVGVLLGVSGRGPVRPLARPLLRPGGLWCPGGRGRWSPGKRTVRPYGRQGAAGTFEVGTGTGARAPTGNPKLRGTVDAPAHVS